MNKIHHKKIKLLVLVFFGAACLLSLQGFVERVHAQGAANITVTGIPPIIQAPFTDQIQENFRNGRYQVIFTYNGSNPAPVGFRFRIQLFKGGKQLIEETSNPKSFRPGAYVFTSFFDELPFPQTFQEVVDKINNSFKKQVLQEGTIPEGSYMLKITAIAEGNNTMIASAPSVTPFTVRYPQPPRLINPMDEANVTLQTPVFNWTPVVGIQGSPIDYDFLLVEVLPNQTPLQALNSNRALAQKTLINQNTLFYTPEFLPLEEGKQYVWQITAHLPNLPLPLKNDGVSEFHTFSYKQGAGLNTDLAALQSIPLVPDFASLTSLNNLEITERAQTYVLNGDATLHLTGNETYDFAVNVKNVTIQKSDLRHPLLTGGSVSTQNVEAPESFLADASHIFDLKDLRWEFGKAMQAKGDIHLPNGSSLKVDDWMQLTREGLNGTLVADNPDGLMQVGNDPVELNITHVEASFPENQLFAQGNINLFNGETTCRVTQLNMLQSQSEAVFKCPDDASISLVQNSAKLKLMLQNLRGTLNYNVEIDRVDYDLTADGNLTLGVDQAGQCSAFMQVNLSQNEGFNITQIDPACSINAPPLDLGFMKFKLDDIDLKSLNYTSDGNWDFDLSLNGFLKMPAMDGWTLPLASVNVTSNGLEFPELNWNKPELDLDGALAIDGFGITPVSFNMPHFTFPWFDGSQDDDAGLGNWDFNFNFDFNFPDFSSNDNEQEGSPTIIPACIVARTIPDVEGNFRNGSFSATLPATVLKGCRIDLTEGYTFTIDKLGGELSAEAGLSDLNLESQIQLDAHFMAGSPFNCGDDKPMSVGETHLTMNSDGLLDGQVDDIVTSCGANIGPFQVGITQSDLAFSSDGGSQHITIGADGELALNANQSVVGNLEYDVLNGKFNELNFSYDDYFVLNLPSSKNNILSFLVKGLSLTKGGLLIDGRQQFILGDTEQVSTLVQSQTGKKIQLPNNVTAIDVTFDQTMISLSDLRIESGRILFDKRFALKAAVTDQSANINFSVPADTANISLDPNTAYLKLGTQVTIDKDGLHTRGRADAGIKISDLSFDDLEVRFNQNFAMGLDPFDVQQGQAELFKSNRRVAYINSTGFHLDPTYLTQALPDTLPLPTIETAYMVLRDADDNLLVNATKQPDGTYIMSTNNPVNLVIPAIQGARPEAPSVAVSFSDITYDPGSGEITKGAIRGDFDPVIDLNDMGVPFKVRSISYNDGLGVNDEEIIGERGLSLEGDILLYQTQIGDAGSVSLFLENGDHLRGDVDLKNLNSDISLVPPNDLALLHVDSLGGSVDVALDELTPPDVSLDMRGQFRLQNQDDNPIAALNYFATYDDGNFGINAKHQPKTSTASNKVFVGPTGFRIDKINTLTLSYSTISNDFDFRSGLDFSVLMKVGDTDTLEVPLHDVSITENGFTIPDQTINRSSTPVLSAPAFTMGPAELDLLEFRTLRNITFNWFTGEGVPPAFEMDLAMKLAGLSGKAPQASQASLTLNSVGYNQGVFTGTIQDYTPPGGNAFPISLGGVASFNLTAIAGGLTNTGTAENPIQGYDIDLAGNLTYPDFFGEPDPDCSEPNLNLKLSKEGGLLGVVHNAAPCGELAYGPATLSFDPSDSLVFAFNNDEQQVLLGGSVNAEIVRDNSPNITATGNIQADVLNGEFIDGQIAVNDLFTYKYPQDNPLFTFRVQHALLNEDGFVITGDAGLTYPNSQDTARVRFTNFTVEPQNGVFTDGHVTFQDSIAFEVGVSPMDWKVVDPSSEFTQDNAGRLLTAAQVTLGTDGLSLSGSSTASIRAGGESLPDLTLDYDNFKLNFSPVGVNSGEASFTRSGDENRFAYIDKDQFHIDLPGLVTSVLPDTLDLPNRETAYLVLGDDDGSRYELEEGSSLRRLHTLDGKTVSLVIPNVKDDSGEPLKIDVAFDARVDQFFNISSGSISLQNTVDLEPYVDIPLRLDSLAYSSRSGLKASASVKLPSSLNDVNLLASVLVGEDGFEQGTISAGDYTETYLPSQEDVEPIAADTLGGGALAFYVRGLEIAFGQTNSIKFSGQLKSDFLKDTNDLKTPIHYAAAYNASTDQWNVSIDEGNLANGIDLGYAQLEPTSESGQPLVKVTMDDQKFALALSAIISMPELLGEDFSLTIDELKISTQPNADGDYVTVDAGADIPPQDFSLINGILDFTSTDTKITLTNSVLALKTSGSFEFYGKTDIDFSDLEFRSDGEVSIGGVSSGNLLDKKIEMLPDSSLVLSELSLGTEDNALKMSATGFAQLPDPLDERAAINISGNTNGDVDVSGPDFIFDEEARVGNNEDTEFEIGSFATLELTGLGVDIHLKNPDQTALYAAGAIYISNDADKSIKIGDAGDLQTNPGIKYSIQGGVEWNVNSTFDPEESPFSFNYEFFSVDVGSIQINSDEDLDGPFQAIIGGKTELNINGVGGKVDFSGFTFSLDGVDDVGQIDGGTFTLMDVVSLELGSFEYKTTDDNGGSPFTLEFAKDEGSAAGSGASVDTVQVRGVTKYLHFGGSGSSAINLSLGEGGFSGGVDEVIYYQKGEGENAERYFKIKNAHLKMNEQVRLTVGMEYLTGNGNYKLAVAGGGKFGPTAFAAAGYIEKNNDDRMRFGIFAAASIPITFAGIVTVNQFGGGFYYRPETSDLEATKAAIRGMDGSFETHGDPPDVEDLKFAALLYGKVAIAGSGDAAAISGNVFIQMTDQFTKLDVTGYVLGQKTRFKAGAYVTILYTPEVVGVEGGVDIDVIYDPILSGNSEVDFFAKSNRTGNKNTLWGISGNFELNVIQILDVDGSLIVSPEGFLLDLHAGAGFDLAVVSADASFDLTVWYLPDYTDAPLGMYAKARIGFDICHGLASFDASIEAGYFKRNNYSMLYFAGEVHVEVVWVIDADVRGWVKVQTKSPHLDYGRGGSAEMEDLIADAKDKANETKEKAEEAKENIDDAKDDMNDALVEAALKPYTDEKLRSVGYNVVSGNYFSTGRDYNNITNVLSAEERLHGADKVPDVIYWIANNVMKGEELYGNSFAHSYADKRERPIIQDDEGPETVSSLDDVIQTRNTQAAALKEVEEDAPAVLERIDTGISQMDGILSRMKASLDDNEPLAIQNPVRDVQDAQTGSGGELNTAPSFQINHDVNESNQSSLSSFEESITARDQRYRDAIEAAAANVDLIDLIASGKASIDWDSGTGLDMSPSAGVSINDLSFTYTKAVEKVREFNAELVGSYWDIADWARVRHDIIQQNKSTIKSFAQKTTDWQLSDPGSDVENATDLVEARVNVIVPSDVQKARDLMHGDLGDANIQKRYEKFENTGNDFWVRMPLLGLQELQTKSSGIADSLAGEFDQKIQAIQNNHQAFTRSVDQLYNIKAQMLTAVYGMIEEYNSWRQEAFKDQNNNEKPTIVNQRIQPPKGLVSRSINVSRNIEAPFTNKKQQIEEALAPPTINRISASGGTSGSWSSEAGYRKYYGTALLSYQASHPQGIPEISYNLKEGSGQDIYSIGNYYSAGVWNNEENTSADRFFKMEFPKKSANQTNRSLTGAIRARGAGGTTIKRNVNFQIAVGPGGESQGATVELGDDTSPPTKPVVSGRYKRGADNFWTTDSTTLRFTFKSSDPESDVRLYKYKIGTTAGGHEIRAWTNAQGSRGTGFQRTDTENNASSSDESVQQGQATTDSQNASTGSLMVVQGQQSQVATQNAASANKVSAVGYPGSAAINAQTVLSPMGTVNFPPYGFTSKMQAVIRGLNLEVGTDYYLSVKAINGDNMESPVKQVSKPFRYEPTPPTSPELTITPNNQERQMAPEQPVVHQGLSGSPQWHAEKINYDQGSDDGQTYTYAWNAEDPESGIKGYWFAWSDAPDATASQVFLSESQNYVPVSEGAEFSFSPDFNTGVYFYLKAENNAGVKSNLKVIGPIKNVDTTIPTTPDVRIKSILDRFNVYITQLSDDAQSGIKGYQYAIFDSTGTTMLRSWPDSTKVDFSLTSNETQSNSHVFKTIPAGLLSAGYYQVAVRAVNNQNMASRAVLNENVLVDKTPPTKTTATIIYQGRNRFKIDFNHIGDDPESGLLSMYYTVNVNAPKVDSPLLNSLNNQTQKMGGRIQNYSIDHPTHITVDDAYFRNYSIESEEGADPSRVLNSESPNLETLRKYLPLGSPQFVIKTTNGKHLNRYNTIFLRIPGQYLIEYLNKVKQAKEGT